MDTSETHASAADRAYAWLRDGVLSRRLAPSDLITEGQVAEAVGVSRTPVREALLRLEADGFVRLLPKRGALVLPVTAAETADVLETRRLIESYAVRCAVATGGSELPGRLRQRLSEMEQAARQRDARAFAEADRAFHAAIVAATGNAILTDLYRRLRDRQLRMGVLTLTDVSGVARMRSTLRQHQAILEAVEARTLRSAEAAVAAHLDSAAAVLAGGRGRP